jgi:transcriptional regulator
MAALQIRAIPRYRCGLRLAMGSIPLLSFVSLFLTRDTSILRAHVARANPVWKQARGDMNSLVVFQGAQAYISPSWYPSKAITHQEVPTWNYCMVQAQGRLQVRDDAAWVLDLITRLSETHEKNQAQPWSVNDAPKDYIDKMLTAVVGIEIVVTSLTGKWKVSQNKKEIDRQGVVTALQGFESEQARAMADQVVAPGSPSRAAR